MKKRILSAFLILCMLLTHLSAAMAAEETRFSDMPAESD